MNQAGGKMSLRALARETLNQPRDAYRRWRLRSQLGRLIRILQAGEPVPKELLRGMIHSWSNEAWSADTDLLESTLTWYGRTSGAIIECGSGLTTLALGAATWTSRRPVTSLEHTPAWAERVRGALPQNCSNINILSASMRDYGEFDWYDIDLRHTAADIGFVVCDGPHGSSRGGRYGLVPVMRQRMAPGCVILLDDSHRPDERAIVARWCGELSAEVIEEGATHSVLKLAGG
jgi:hypothetical protein